MNLKTLSFISLLLLFQYPLFSQSNSDKKLPADSSVKIGKLKNGLTYYIRKNSKPENRVEMRLVVKAGSVLEDDDQQGLAHFVEHMAFNGTKNFEKNELIDYLESLGIQFGPEINAYTGFDETVYMLTLPTDSAHILNTGFQVMEDWAHNLTFNHEEIDKERGVVLEEWRIGRGAYQRILDKILPVVLKDSKYAERLPIGKKEIIENFEYKTLVKFYRDWYRPDLMAFIIVGDIDVEETELMIKEHFNQFEVKENARKRVYYTIPDHYETLVTIATDKEMPGTSVAIYYKKDAKDIKTYDDYRFMFLYSLFTGMLNQRLNELKEKPEPPFIDADTYYGDFLAKNKKVYEASAIVSETGVVKGLKTLLEENHRVNLHGFTDSELKRYKKVLLNFYEKAYSEKDKTESDSYASEYVRNFLNNEPIPGIEFEYEFVKEYLPGIKLDELNQLANKLITRENRVIVVTEPEKKDIPVINKEELLSIANTVDNSELEPYVDKITGSDLMVVKPDKGRILFSKKLKDIDAVEFKLSNGAKVVLKSTDFKNDEILMRAESKGGMSQVPDEDHQSALHASDIINESGIGEYSKTDLQKMLAGKTIHVSSKIEMYTESIVGNSSPKDMETLFQLTYLYFTKPHKDESAYQSYINKQKALYKNVLSDPVQYFYNQYRILKASNHSRAIVIPKEEDWEKIDFQEVYKIYSNRFSDASDFTFFFVGAFKIDSIKPLIEQYIASLPSGNTNESWKDLGIRPPEKTLEKNIYKGTDPKSIVITYFETKKPWNEHDAFLFSIVGNILNREYLKILREEMSGVYSVQTKAIFSKIPYDHASLQILMPCSPDNTDSLTIAAFDEIRKIQEQGISNEDLKKEKEIQRRKIEKDSKTNSFWINSFQKNYRMGTSFDYLLPNEEIINSITSQDIQRVASEYINLDKYLKVVLYPETMNSGNDLNQN